MLEWILLWLWLFHAVGALIEYAFVVLQNILQRQRVTKKGKWINELPYKGLRVLLDYCGHFGPPPTKLVLPVGPSFRRSSLLLPTLIISLGSWYLTVMVEPSGRTTNVGYFLQYVFLFIFVTTARLALRFRMCVKNTLELETKDDFPQFHSMELINFML